MHLKRNTNLYETELIFTFFSENSQRATQGDIVLQAIKSYLSPARITQMSL